MSLQSLALLAQTDSTNTNVWLMFGLFLAAIAVPVVIGNMIAKSMRMTDYGWKIGLILASGCVAALIVARGFPPKLGIDLKGGEILIYEVDEAATVAATQDATASIDMNNLVATIANRLNPSGTKELVVRKYGDRQIEIIVPDATDLEIKQIKANIVAAGNLQFRIVANLSDHATLIAKARVQAGDEKRRQPLVRSDDGKTVLGRWVRVGVDSESKADPKPHKVDVFGATIRNSRTGELITIDSSQANTEDEPTKFEKWLKEKKSPEIDVLMYANDGYNVQGSHIQSVRVSIDEAARPCVNFTMKPEGANLFGRLTLANRPVENRRRRLGIIMDGALLSAPAIQSVIDNEGQITGRFTEAEVKFLVDILNAGSLPAILQSTPISENQIGSLLGQETIDSGTLAISISLLSVLIFIIIYYRFSGVVACAALLFNLLLILALMILVNATLTLPGLAGLVLTIGMSVDANVLVFERIREEVNKGAALRMAIRNGFSRATTTIVDANLTTLITALVLYGIGTDQIKGFAVTLVLGILMSMFTAIFCSRVIFDIAERRRWITKLTMMQILGATSIDFIGKRKVAAIVSGFLIIVGLCAVGARQKQIFDIDFLGGTSVVMELDTQNGKQLSDAEVREILQETLGEMTTNDTRVQYTLNRVNVTGTDNSVWKIDSSLPEVEDLQRVLEDNFQLVSYSMKFNGVTGVKDDDDKAGDDESGDDKAGDDKQSAFLKYGYFVSTNAQETPANQTPTTETPAEGTAGGDAGQSSFERSETTVEFTDYKIDEPTLRQAIYDTADSLPDVSRPTVYLSSDAAGWTIGSGVGLHEWKVKFFAPPEDATAIMNALQSSIEGTPVWQSSSKIGGKVAGDTQWQAIQALLTSLIGIVAYIWIRFQRVTFGLAAVVALVHDVLITLGAIAVSYWVADALPFLLIEEFKISLPVVAAFLTIIGYSLNDTIVVFDRIREVRGRSPQLTEAMINQSINQTLSRTLLTSLTTFAVVMILYTIGGQGIHGFAFSLVIGVLVGTYSSIFVASPVLYWMMSRGAKTRKSAKPKTA